MRTNLQNPVGMFRSLAARMFAALHQQRAIEAQRALRRYRDLLDSQQEALPLNEIDSVRSGEEFSENADQSLAHRRPAGAHDLEHA